MKTELINEFLCHFNGKRLRNLVRLAYIAQCKKEEFCLEYFEIQPKVKLVKPMTLDS